MNMRANSSTLVLIAAALSVTFSTRAEEDPRVAQSRSLSGQLASELSSALQAAIKEGGPVSAIAVCQQQAPRIAERLSKASGAVVSRTGLKVRNPGNAPQPWQREVLKRFEQRRAAGEEIASLEHFEPAANGGARYMKAIGMQPLCALCHGEQITPEIKAALRQRYPQDAATGFRPGELRGAFSVTWAPQERAARP
jgi:hypothetical protein